MSLRTALKTGTQLFTTGRGLVSLGQLVVVFFLGLVVHWVWAGSEGTGAKPTGHEHHEGEDAATKWTCSMHPQIQKDGPGACPLCGMDLIPLKPSSGKMTGMRHLAVSPQARALMNIQVTPVQRQYVTAEVRMVGKVDYDETRLKDITAWVPGRLDRLFVDYTGVEVKKGDHMVYIYSEKLYTAQQELIDAVRSARERKSARESKKDKSFFTGGIDYPEVFREKLRLLGLTPEQIAEIEQRDKPSDHVMIYAPRGGIVVKKMRNQGDRVKVGDPIYTVADLSQVWVKMDAYEADLMWLRYGQNVAFTTEAYPGEKFEGRIAFIDPVLNEKTRTVKVRVNVSNKAGKLKPEMFVRAVVRANIAAGGRVIDPDLTGKWISPMHPEIVKDEPGMCDICGMPLVRAESIGYASPKSRNAEEPLVIPVSAALVTGTRAVVYVEMPSLPRGLETEVQLVTEALGDEKLDRFHSSIATLEKILAKPHKQLHTEYAHQLWNTFAGRLQVVARNGMQAKSLGDAQDVLGELAEIMEETHGHFAAPDQPTFAGREIVLGPRADDYYLVRSGLQEGEMVVTRGNFKIDSALQIMAKPSMMTPMGGGGGGSHDHGGHGGKKAKKRSSRSAKVTDLPVAMQRKLLDLVAAYEDVESAVQVGKLEQVRTKFKGFGEVLTGIDGKLLSGHAKMAWGEFSMLLGNDAVEGSDVTEAKEAQRVFTSLAMTMNRVDAQFGLSNITDVPRRLEAPIAFQKQLGGLWQSYLAMGAALAADDFPKAQRAVKDFGKALGAVDMALLKEPAAHHAWMKEYSGLKKIQAKLAVARDIKALREDFALLSGATQVIAMTFGFGPGLPVYQLHCPMAFGNKGASWLQDNDQTRNPYFGTTMLKCADRVEAIAGTE